MTDIPDHIGKRACAVDLTLRDWFAGQALAGFAGLPEDEVMGAADTAKAAYNYADAMLAEREKRNDR
jgi:hypothetical protein